MSNNDTFASTRKEYERGTLDERSANRDPIVQFRSWFEDATKSSEVEPNACALATVGQHSAPSLRMVLLKSLDERGFVFFTNYESRKGRELARNSVAAILFYWASLERQVRVEGEIEIVSAAESDAYFASRPRNAQLGALISKQSEVVSSRKALDESYAEAAQAAGESPLVRPSNWGGYRLIPSYFEFWQGRESRLHDRVRYSKGDGHEWAITRLWP
jgi:pyridoxamine 5'-phosphate oxidase